MYVRLLTTTTRVRVRVGVTCVMSGMRTIGRYRVVGRGAFSRTLLLSPSSTRVDFYSSPSTRVDDPRNRRVSLAPEEPTKVKKKKNVIFSRKLITVNGTTRLDRSGGGDSVFRGETYAAPLPPCTRSAKFSPSRSVRHGHGNVLRQQR